MLNLFLTFSYEWREILQRHKHKKYEHGATPDKKKHVKKTSQGSHEFQYFQEKYCKKLIIILQAM